LYPRGRQLKKVRFLAVKKPKKNEKMLQIVLRKEKENER
jgi:hypothetical protein